MGNNMPDLSVIMITPDSYETIQKTINTIRKQTVIDRLELIIVAPVDIDLCPDESALNDFLNHRIIRINTLTSLGSAKAVGIREARAPIIALIEEHVYPDPRWAEALINAHQKPWAAVGPAIRNAEPKNLISWADFLITYGQWMEPVPDKTPSILPGHNSSYKRDILLSYGDELADMMEVEAILHQDFHKKGFKIYQDPKAIIYHLGFSKLIASLPVQFHIGRLFAADRAKHWPFINRLIFICGSPLIPLVRFYRLVRRLVQSGTERRCPYTALPLTLPGLISSATGELAGYALGAGNSPERMIAHEFHRDQH